MIIPNIWENKKCSKPPTRNFHGPKLPQPLSKHFASLGPSGLPRRINKHHQALVMAGFEYSGASLAIGQGWFQDSQRPDKIESAPTMAFVAPLATSRLISSISLRIESLFDWWTKVMGWNSCPRMSTNRFQVQSVGNSSDDPWQGLGWLGNRGALSMPSWKSNHFRGFGASR